MKKTKFPALAALTFLAAIIFSLPALAAQSITILTEPEPAFGGVGDVLNFNIYASGDGLLSYVWYWTLEDASTGEILEENELGFGSSASLTLNSKMADTTKKSYVYCLVSDESGDIATSAKVEAAVRTNVMSQPEITIVYQPSGETTCFVGDELMISAAISISESSLGNLSYQWYQSGSTSVKLDGENKPYLIVPTDTVGVSSYFCRVTNEKNGLVTESDDDGKVIVKVEAKPDISFSDVSVDAWYYESVRSACATGLFKGKSPTSFCPSDGMTIAEAVTLACRLNQLDKDGTITLTNGSPWYSTFMSYAVENKIIDSDLSDMANEPITRGLFAKIFAASLPGERFENVREIADGSIPDVPTSSDESAAIYKLYRAGILNGYEDGKFHPDSLITRAEAAVVVSRMK